MYMRQCQVEMMQQPQMVWQYVDVSASLVEVAHMEVIETDLHRPIYFTIYISYRRDRLTSYFAIYISYRRDRLTSYFAIYRVILGSGAAPERSVPYLFLIVKIETVGAMHVHVY